MQREPVEDSSESRLETFGLSPVGPVQRRRTAATAGPVVDEPLGKTSRFLGAMDDGAVDERRLHLDVGMVQRADALDVAGLDCLDQALGESPGRWDARCPHGPSIPMRWRRCEAA